MSFVFSYAIFKAFVCWWAQRVKQRHTLFEKFHLEKNLAKVWERHSRTYLSGIKLLACVCIYLSVYSLAHTHTCHVNMGCSKSYLSACSVNSKSKLSKNMLFTEIFFLLHLIRFSDPHLFIWDWKISFKTMAKWVTDNFRKNNPREKITSTHQLIFMLKSFWIHRYINLNDF